MDFEQGTSEGNNQKLEDGFIESKYGQEFTSYCQFSEASSVDPSYTSVVDTTSMQEDTEEYDKMPNLVSQESPSRTLGFVTVPLRQTNKLQSGETNKRDRNSVVKEENVLEADNDNDMMYPLHNFSDLLEGPEEVDATETPEFLELELDPSTLLRGEPPALQPMFTGNNHGHRQSPQCSNNNSTGHSSKRSASRQSGSNNFHRYEVDVTRSLPSSLSTTRRASVGSPENSVSYKKYDCHVCGIKFEFAETLKSHLESHGGARNIRSNSEDQSANPNPMPLPRLLPRPTINVSDAVSLEVGDTGVVLTAKVPKSSKKSSSQMSTSSSSSSSSSLTSSAKSIAALKRRKRYNQTRPCALKCPECNLPIRDKSRLIEHLRGHTGERPFECTVCDKAYTRRDVLKTHMLKMHGIAPQFQTS